MTTHGLNHLGLSVRNLDETTRFFVSALEWEEIARDEAYPRSTVTDGALRLTLWQVTDPSLAPSVDRHVYVGLHHLALTVPTEAELARLAQAVSSWPGVTIEFMPELMGTGPRKHMIFAEPGGLRIELTWPGP